LASPLADLWPPAGLGLTGEGAEAVARGLLASALAAGADDGPEERVRVVVATTLATLLGAAAVDLPANPRLLRHDTGPGAAPGGAETGTPAPADTDSGQAASPADPEDQSRRHPDQNEEAASKGQATVSVLGEPHIDVADAAQNGEPLRAKARELLVYLAAVGGKVSQDTILEDLLPDAPARKAPHRLHTYVYNLRRHLNHIGGKNTYLQHPGHHYVLSHDALEVDLWQMRAALADAQAATDPAAKIAALRHAISAYRGPLADGCGYEWIEPHREGIRQQALNAYLALADLIADDQPAEALALAQAAIEVDPYADAAYRTAMAICADLGDLDAIRTLRRALTRRMAEIDAEPNDATLALADRLIIQLQRHRPTRKPRDAAS
jgi:DNA-binding SARP family transcriptional activator